MKILFPFGQSQDNRQAYSFAVEVAIQTGAELVMATTTWTEEDSLEGDISGMEISDHETDKTNSHLYLLELWGYYQTYYNNWQGNIGVKMSQRISDEPLGIHLASLLEQEGYDMLVMPYSGNDEGGLHEETCEFIMKKFAVPTIRLHKDFHFAPSLVRIGGRTSQQYRMKALELALDQVTMENMDHTLLEALKHSSPTKSSNSSTSAHENLIEDPTFLREITIEELDES